MGIGPRSFRVYIRTIAGAASALAFPLPEVDEMRSLAAWFLLSLTSILPANLTAQVAPSPRFVAPATTTRSVERADTIWRGERPPIPAGFILEQTAAATGGFATAALAGGLVGGLLATAGTERNSAGFEGLLGMLAGAVLAGPVGAAIAVERFSRPQGITSSVWAAMAGGYVGWFGGPAFYLTVPLGTVTAYNLARR